MAVYDPSNLPNPYSLENILGQTPFWNPKTSTDMMKVQRYLEDNQFPEFRSLLLSPRTKPNRPILERQKYVLEHEIPVLEANIEKLSPAQQQYLLRKKTRLYDINRLINRANTPKDPFYEKQPPEIHNIQDWPYAGDPRYVLGYTFEPGKPIELDAPALSEARLDAPKDFKKSPAKFFGLILGLTKEVDELSKLKHPTEAEKFLLGVKQSELQQAAAEYAEIAQKNVEFRNYDPYSIPSQITKSVPRRQPGRLMPKLDFVDKDKVEFRSRPYIVQVPKNTPFGETKPILPEHYGEHYGDVQKSELSLATSAPGAVKKLHREGFLGTVADAAAASIEKKILGKPAEFQKELFSRTNPVPGEEIDLLDEATIDRIADTWQLTLNSYRHGVALKIPGWKYYTIPGQEGEPGVTLAFGVDPESGGALINIIFTGTQSESDLNYDLSSEDTETLYYYAGRKLREPLILPKGIAKILKDMERDLRAIIEAIINGNFKLAQIDVLGHSLGGGLAQGFGQLLALLLPADQLSRTHIDTKESMLGASKEMYDRFITDPIYREFIMNNYIVKSTQDPIPLVPFKGKHSFRSMGREINLPAVVRDGLIKGLDLGKAFEIYLGMHSMIPTTYEVKRLKDLYETASQLNTTIAQIAEAEQKGKKLHVYNAAPQTNVGEELGPLTRNLLYLQTDPIPNDEELEDVGEVLDEIQRQTQEQEAYERNKEGWFATWLKKFLGGSKINKERGGKKKRVGRFKKGSKAAKEYMAYLRSLRKS